MTKGAPICESFTMTPLDNATVTPNTLVETILGSDIASYNLKKFQGIAINDLTEGNEEHASAGLFSEGIAAGIGIESGIVLSSGFINNAIGPNESSSITGVLNLGGDQDLNDLSGQTTYDATILEFEFVPDFDELFIRYVFGSDEYPQYVGTVNDVFAFFLNGENIALVPGGNEPVAISTINEDENNHLYKNNHLIESENDPDWPVFCNEMDGFTTVLTAVGDVNRGEPNTIKLAIADASDNVIDSWVFVEAEGVTGEDPEQASPIPVSNWALYLSILLLVTLVVLRFKKAF